MAKSSTLYGDEPGVYRAVFSFDETRGPAGIDFRRCFLFDSEGNKLKSQVVRTETVRDKDGRYRYEILYREIRLEEGIYWMFTRTAGLHGGNLERITVNGSKVFSSLFIGGIGTADKINEALDNKDSPYRERFITPYRERFITNPEVPRPVVQAIFNHYEIKRKVPEAQSTA
ncbi:hypothetical protein MYX07_04240 [Patescibacteria group bacterium AH-259-L07]|nr:hypothetical protein [Patescibacteria group bacterium AH-259-L07]